MENLKKLFENKLLRTLLIAIVIIILIGTSDVLM